MLRLVMAAAAALLLLRGDMYPDASNAKLPEAQENLGIEISLEGFGAKCDGVTDDAPAFAAAAATNRVVRLPPGKTCVTTKTVEVGDGRQQSTTLSAPPAGTSYPVASCAGVLAGDAFAVRRTDGTLHTGTVTGCAGTTLTGTTYSGSAAGAGNAVYTGKVSSLGGGFRGAGGCWSSATNGITIIKYTGPASPTTTLAAGAATGARQITVVSAAQVAISDAVGVTLNDGSVFWTWAAETPAGTTVKLGNELPGPAASGNLVKLEGDPVARINGPVFGAVFEGICLNANGLAAVGFHSRHSRQGRFNRNSGVNVTSYTGVAHYIHSAEFYVGSATGSGDNEYELHAFLPANTKTIGCWIRGTPPPSPTTVTSGGVALSRNRFYGGTCRAGGNDTRSAGMLIEWADNNTWYKPYTPGPVGANNSAGVYLQPSYNGVNFPNENTFYSAAAIGGVVEGTATGGVTGASRWPDYSTYDSEPLPVGSSAISGTTSAGVPFGNATPLIFDGLRLSRASSGQIAIAVGQATDSTGQHLLVLPDTCTASLGTSNNIQGMDAVTTRLPNTWYAVFLVGDTLTGFASCMLAQTTAAAVPGIAMPEGLGVGFRFWAYVGRFKTDGSSNIATTAPILPRGQFYIDAGDTYTPGASGFTPRSVRFLACGGGASGGSGGLQVSGAAISGGSGGSGGGCDDRTVPLTELPATIPVTIGATAAALSPPAGPTAAGTSSNPGAPTFFGASATTAISFGAGGCAGSGGQLAAASASGGAGLGQKNANAGIVLCTAAVGSTVGNAPTGGVAGSATTGNVSPIPGNGASGSGGLATGAAGPAGGHATGSFSCAGGGAGGGVQAAGPTATSGGAGGANAGTGLPRANGGAGNGSNGALDSVWLPGGAAGGGGGATAGTAGNGGAGAQCAGGGGGGSALNGSTAGAGGAGGAGYAFVWELR